MGTDRRRAGSLCTVVELSVWSRKRQAMESFPEEEVLAYLGMLAKFATCTDEELDDDETVFLLAMIDAMPLSLASRKTFCDFLDSGVTEMKQETVEPFVSGLRGSILRFPFIADLLLLSYADGVYDDGEVALVADTCKSLGISTAQYEAIFKYMQAVATLHLDEDAPADLLAASGCKDDFIAAGIPETAFDFFVKGETPATVVTLQACERVKAELKACGFDLDASEDEGTLSRGFGQRSFTSYFYHSMVRSTKRNLFASIIHKVTGTRRPHSWINIFYWLTGRRRMRYSKRPSGMLHMAGTIASLSGH